MKLTIDCETTLSFDIKAHLSCDKRNAIEDDYLLELSGGEWHLSRYPDKWWNIAQGRVHWTEALKRALIKIERETREAESLLSI